MIGETRRNRYIYIYRNIDCLGKPLAKGVRRSCVTVEDGWERGQMSRADGPDRRLAGWLESRGGGSMSGGRPAERGGTEQGNKYVCGLPKSSWSF